MPDQAYSALSGYNKFLNIILFNLTHIAVNGLQLIITTLRPLQAKQKHNTRKVQFKFQKFIKQFN